MTTSRTPLLAADAPLGRRRLLTLAGLALLTPSLAACVTGGHTDGPDGPDPRGAAGDAGDMSLVSADVTRATPTDAALDDGRAAVAGLVAALWPRLGLGPDANGAISPVSVTLALAMVAAGARGRTASELTGVLGELPVERLTAGANAVAQDLEGRAGEIEGDPDQRSIALVSADQVFAQRDVDWQEPFLDILARDFGTGVRAVDFVGDAEGARTAINGWTAGQTRGRIRQIVPEGALDADTRMVLVDALYLKAPWATPFELTRTEDAAFTLADGTAASVPTMHGAAPLTGRGDGFVSARLPYAGNRLAMTLVLPDEGREDVVARRLADGDLSALLAVGPALADVAVPRWTFRTQRPLAEPLQAAGVERAFTDDADFSAMTTQERLAISSVLHEVFIAVDERGTEAAAATAVVMRATTGFAGERLRIDFDRPFLFVIHTVDRQTAPEATVPLFLGWCADPR